MFTNNLIKRPKLDAKRKKAIAYFNNKFPNSPVVEKSGFWTFNRVKILLSAGVALLAAWVIAFKFAGNGKVFLALLACAYILAPFVCFRLNKYPATTKIKNMKFIKVVSRVYRQSELPSGLAIASAFLTVLTVILFKLFDTHGLIVYLVSVTPFLMYHLLCFIGDHPLAIFTSIRYLPAINNSSYNVQHFPQNSTSTPYYDNDCAPNGIPGDTGWVIYHSEGSSSSIGDSNSTHHNY